jgi:hypothetical protein
VPACAVLRARSKVFRSTHPSLSQVVLRVRPPLAGDERPGPLEFDESTPGRLILHRPDAPVAATEFTFDKVSWGRIFISCWPLVLPASSLAPDTLQVLPPGSTQHDVYMSGVKDVVDDVLKVGCRGGKEDMFAGVSACYHRT